MVMAVIAKLNHVLPFLLFLAGSIAFIAGTVLIIVREWPK